ncbi:MAG: alpha/beta fold hydrolase [Clostridia bacterium]|nr:alpha/beta fold hydrolase [Clostridia bacterium]
MAIEKKKISVPSADGIHTLFGVVYAPTGVKKGLFQVVHGMTEHIERYDKFMRELCEAGWVVFGHNHLGHKGSVRVDAELGYVAQKDGWDLLARDVKGVYDAVRAEYGEDLPYSLMGHSMGSFVVRVAAEKYVRPDRLVIMGTGGSNPAAGAGLALIALIKRMRGEKHISPMIDALAFGSYNKRFGGGTDADPKPWLSTDEKVRERYYADPYCMFPFTVSAMGDLIRVMKESNRAAWYRNLPSDLKILLVSGAEDPVGNYGRGVREVHEKLQNAGRDAICRIYDGARHEILNDFTYERVRDDILKFCEA